VINAILVCAVLGTVLSADVPVQSPAATTPANRQARPATSTSPQAPQTAATPKPPPQPKDLIEQGKRSYRLKQYKAALDKFEGALKLSPDDDEALGLAAVTAFRLDNQSRARELFARRAELPNQKDSVKAYCYQRIALSIWRQVHQTVAKSRTYDAQGNLVIKASNETATVTTQITTGLDFVSRALKISPQFSEAYTVASLLHADAASATTDKAQAEQEESKSVEALRQAIQQYRPVASAAATEVANFSVPTLMAGDFGSTPEIDARLASEMPKGVQGGRPLTRVSAAFPAVKPPTAEVDSQDPAATGVTSQGGAYSVGSGRGALRAAYLPGTVRIEVLVSVSGKVVFAHVVDGRSDLNPSALAAARRWTFAPARFEGHPVQVSGVITFNMRPRGAPAPASNPPQ
jgi:TonB family protein